MSTSAILPISSVDFDSTSATASQQAVFANLLQQLEQAISGGDLTTSQTLWNAITTLSPSAASGSDPIGTFLTSLASALSDGSLSAAQTALSTYVSTDPAPATAAGATPAVTNTNAATIASNLVLSQIQLSLVTTLLGAGSVTSELAGATTAAASTASSASSLIGILNAAYPAGGSTAATTSSAATATSAGTSADTQANSPYDTLVSSIQASLAAGNGTITPALAYLQASGNFVNTTA